LKAKAEGASGDTFRVRSDGRGMMEIAEMLEKKIIRSHISKIFEFGDIRAAHQHIETGKTKGKIVVTIS